MNHSDSRRDSSSRVSTKSLPVKSHIAANSTA
jgi:hypothetical protein